MKYCTNCHRITTGDALFCNRCGRSYDVRFCPRLHPNPRAAQVCAQCGSRELSSPQPKGNLGTLPISLFARILPGAVLVMVTLFFGLSLVEALVRAQNVVVPLLLRAGSLLLLAWVLYLVLPHFVQRALKAIADRITKSKDKGHGHGPSKH